MLVRLGKASQKIICARDRPQFRWHDVLNRKLFQAKVQSSKPAQDDHFPGHVYAVQVIARVRFLESSPSFEVRNQVGQTHADAHGKAL